MKQNDIIRAWKDEEFRLSLTDEQRAQLPQNPAGVIELADDELRSVAGGATCRCFCPDEVSCL